MALIRERQEADLEGCAEALRAVHADTGYPVRGIADPVGFIKNADTIRAWVAEYEGRIVGHVAIAKSSPSASDYVLWQEHGNGDEVAALERLFVHPQAQGMSIAKKLITAAVEHARDLSLRLVLYNLEKDTIARAMYAKFGWTFYGNFQFSWEEGKEMKAHCFVSPPLAQV